MSKYNYKIVSLYVDKNNVLYVIPNGLILKNNMDAEIDILNILEPPYSDSAIEGLVLEAFNQCYTKIKEDFNTIGPLEKHFGVKSWTTATRNLKYMLVEWEKDEGYSVNPFKKVKGGSYDCINKIKVLGHNLKEGELAVAIKQAIEESTTF